MFVCMSLVYPKRLYTDTEKNYTSASLIHVSSLPIGSERFLHNITHNCKKPLPSFAVVANKYLHVRKLHIDFTVIDWSLPIVQYTVYPLAQINLVHHTPKVKFLTPMSYLLYSGA